MKNVLRHYWHDLYYALATPRAVDFAMRCQDVGEIIDLGRTPRGWKNRFRFRLHLSLCQACMNYEKTRLTLRRAVRLLADEASRSLDLGRLNRKLLEKFRK